MKLKLDKEVQDVVDAVAALPDNGTTDLVMWEPHSLLSKFQKSLESRKDSKDLPAKQYAKLRRQLSFLYEFVHICSNLDSTQTDIKAAQYARLIRLFKDVKSGELLKDVLLTRMALRYGVVYLSDQEIQSLIAGNKI